MYETCRRSNPLDKHPLQETFHPLRRFVVDGQSKISTTEVASAEMTTGRKTAALITGAKVQPYVDIRPDIQHMVEFCEREGFRTEVLVNSSDLFDEEEVHYLCPCNLCHNSHYSSNFTQWLSMVLSRPCCYAFSTACLSLKDFVFLLSYCHFYTCLYCKILNQSINILCRVLGRALCSAL